MDIQSKVRFDLAGSLCSERLRWGIQTCLVDFRVQGRSFVSVLQRKTSNQR
jgi:hypothetical protein